GFCRCIAGRAAGPARRPRVDLPPGRADDRRGPADDPAADGHGRVLRVGAGETVTLFTLPCRGRVGERSEPGWGVSPPIPPHPAPTEPNSFAASTLPLKGRVKQK